MTGIWLDWAADCAREAVAGTGYRVLEVAGWQTRGHGGYRVVEGIVGHHTGTPDKAAGDYPSLNIVTNGRADLAGPLCTFGLGRDGTIYVVAAGLAWHAGASAWAGFVDLNDEFAGVEAESAGGGKWTREQLDCYPRLVGAFLRRINRTPERYISHRGCAKPAGRKPDPTGIDDKWMRDEVVRLAAGPAPAPASPPPAPAERSRAQVLADNGILRAAEVVELADATGLELAAACAMLEKESSGGHNVWGRDGTNTGDYYVKGAEVTRAAYEAWKPHRKELGSQGVGPTQLTYGPFQDQADAQGGCWDWRTNIAVGFGILAGDIKSRGVRLAFRTYNGGPNPTGQNLIAAENYATDAMNRYNTWRARLANATTQEVDDMAAVPQSEWNEIRDLVRWMWSQFAGENAKSFEFTGWPPLPGGSGTRRTLVDYGRSSDVQNEDIKRRLAALEAKLGA